jgi:hypothetical protein
MSLLCCLRENGITCLLTCFAAFQKFQRDIAVYLSSAKDPQENS